MASLIGEEELEKSIEGIKDEPQPLPQQQQEFEQLKTQDLQQILHEEENPVVVEDEAGKEMAESPAEVTCFVPDSIGVTPIKGAAIAEKPVCKANVPVEEKSTLEGIPQHSDDRMETLRVSVLGDESRQYSSQGSIKLPDTMESPRS